MANQIDLYNSSQETWLKYVFSLIYRLSSNYEILENCQAEMLSAVKSPYESIKVNIGPHTYINTVKFKCQNSTDTTQSFLFIPGFGMGFGTFVKNFDILVEFSDVYAIDLLGFGLSSRPTFSSVPEEIVDQFTQSIEDWRLALGIQKLILVGHSFGGYIATQYAINYPKNVTHLILIEPWGFPPKQSNQGDFLNRTKIKVSPVTFAIAKFQLKFLLPFAFVRITSRFAAYFFRKMRPDLIRIFRDVLSSKTIVDYFVHYNSQYPSGEIAFSALHIPMGWSRVPLLPERIKQLDSEVGINFIYGSRSWMSCESCDTVKHILTRNKLEMVVIDGASHHVYAEKVGEVNQILVGICQKLF